MRRGKMVSRSYICSLYIVQFHKYMLWHGLVVLRRFIRWNVHNLFSDDVSSNSAFAEFDPGSLVVDPSGFSMMQTAPQLPVPWAHRRLNAYKGILARLGECWMSHGCLQGWNPMIGGNMYFLKVCVFFFCCDVCVCVWKITRYCLLTNQPIRNDHRVFTGKLSS